MPIFKVEGTRAALVFAKSKHTLLNLPPLGFATALLFASKALLWMAHQTVLRPMVVQRLSWGATTWNAVATFNVMWFELIDDAAPRTQVIDEAKHLREVSHEPA